METDLACERCDRSKVIRHPAAQLTRTRVLCIRCTVGESRGRWARQIPDVENIPKLIVDAFTGLLYHDDNLNHVRGVQVEAGWGPDEQERAEVWIFGLPKQGANSSSGA